MIIDEMVSDAEDEMRRMKQIFADGNSD